VYLLGKKLASFATSDEVFSVEDGRGPVKPNLESFDDQVSRGRMIATGTRVNFK